MTHRRAFLIVLLTISAVLLVIAIVWSPRPAVVERQKTGLKVIVMGVDGLDWVLLGKYMDSGQLPNINRIMRAAVSANVEADIPPLPQVGWTVAGRGAPLTESEMATAQSPNDKRLFGILPELASAVEHGGGRALVVGWPTSWPTSGNAEAAVAPYPPAATEHTRSLAPALFDGAPGQTTGDEFSAVVSEAVQRNMSTIDGDFQKTIHAGCDDDALESEDLTAVKWGYLADRTTLDVAGHLTAELEPDLTMVYMGGLDAAMHRFLGQAAPEYFEGIDLGRESCADVVPNYYRFVDEAVGRLLRLTDERTIFMLVSVYGTHPSATNPPSTGGHELGSPGVLLVRGPHLPRTEGEFSVATADLAPTILAALGIAIPMEMTGRVRSEIVPNGLLEHFPPKIMDTPTKFAESVPTPEECIPMENRVDERLGELRVTP